MKLRYTERALDEIDKAVEYIGARSPQGAESVARRIREVLTVLELQPYAGARAYRKTRRFILKPYPYAVIYTIRSGEIVVLRFRHTARNKQ